MITCSAALARPRTWRSPASSTRPAQSGARHRHVRRSPRAAPFSSAGWVPRTREVTAPITSRMRAQQRDGNAQSSTRGDPFVFSPKRSGNNSGSRRRTPHWPKAAANGFLISWPIVARTDSRIVAGIPRACSNTSRGWRSNSSCARKRRMHSSMSSAKSGLRQRERRAGGQHAGPSGSPGSSRANTCIDGSGAQQCYAAARTRQPAWSRLPQSAARTPNPRPAPTPARARR